MEFWIKAAQLVLSLSILVFLHELGHFIPARFFKTRVEKFYLFFNPWFSLFKKKIGETEWGIGWLPLGGYVKIAGMVDESMDKEQLAQPAQPWEFRSKPAWQRLIIMIGGVVVNLIVGFVIYGMVLFAWGKDYISQEDLKYGFSVSELAQEIGFQNGDKVLSVDGESLKDQLEVNRHLMLRSPKSIEVLRADGSKETIKVPESFADSMWANDDMQPLTPRLYPVVNGPYLAENGAAKNAGIQHNDSILSVNGTTVKYYDEFLAIVSNPEVDTVNISLSRNGAIKDFTLLKDSVGKIGIGPKLVDNSSYNISHQDYSFGSSIGLGFSTAYWTLHDYVVQFKFVFTKKGAKSVGGFAAIGNMFAPSWDWQIFWERTALISIILAFMNILPIPALDGGHVVFLLYEIITRREPPQKVLEYAQMIGFFILIGLLLYANGNDIYRFIFGG